MLHIDVGCARSIAAGDSWNCASERHSESLLRRIVGNLALMRTCNLAISTRNPLKQCDENTPACTQQRTCFGMKMDEVSDAPSWVRKLKRTERLQSIFLYLFHFVPIFLSQGWLNMARHGPEMSRTFQNLILGASWIDVPSNWGDFKPMLQCFNGPW